MATKKIFVGYFSSALRPLRLIMALIKQSVGVLEVALYRKPIGLMGDVYCCRLSFASKELARASILRLQNRSFRGNRLLVRQWRERTAANERRDIYWRALDFNGVNRRQHDRRDYQSLKYIYNGHLRVRRAEKKNASASSPAPYWISVRERACPSS
jgi:hypothetical protein